MELNITSLLETDAFQYSASRMEMGQDAGRITWRNNVETASNPPASDLLDTEEKREAFRDFVKSSGGWTREEIAAWNHQELTALCHQWIMGDVRKCPATLDGITFREESDGWYFESEDTPDMETGPFNSRSDAYTDACPGHRGSYPSADSLTEIDWQEYQVMAEQGTISSRLYHNDNGKYFFYIGN